MMTPCKVSDNYHQASTRAKIKIALLACQDCKEYFANSLSVKQIGARMNKTISLGALLARCLEGREL